MGNAVITFYDKNTKMQTLLLKHNTKDITVAEIL
jgi:hypothetical protein